MQLAVAAEAKVKQNMAMEIYSNYFQYKAQEECQVISLPHEEDSFH
jgi:hypothetical protein